MANVILAKTKGFGGGTLMINFGWGFAVYAGVIVAYNSGAHLNPAVTIGLVAKGATEFVPGVAVTALSILTYIGAQMVGAIIGSVFVFLAYNQHFDAEPDAGNKLAVFSTGPGIRHYGWNLVTEIIGTFVLVFIVIGTFVLAFIVIGTFVLVFVVIGFGGGRQGEGGLAARRHPRYRHRCEPRWPDRLRHQPGP